MGLPPRLRRSSSLWQAVTFAAVCVFLGCEPPAPACPAGQIEDGETCVSEACAIGEWGDLPSVAESADGPVLWVAPWGRNQNPGTQDEPFDRIQDAAEAADGGFVLVASGRYERNIELGADTDGVRIIGRCSSLTILDGSAEPAPTVDLKEGRQSLRALTVTGGVIGIAADANAPGVPDIDLFAADVIVLDNEGVGIFAAGGVSMRLEDVTIQGVTANEDTSTGRGLDVEVGAEVVGERLIIQDTVRTGVVSAVNGASVELRDSVIRRNRQWEDENGTDGVVVAQGGSIRFERVTVEDFDLHGITLLGGSTTAELIDVTVRNGLGPPGESLVGTSWGVGVDSAFLSASGLHIEEALARGLEFFGPAAGVLEDLTVVGTTARSDGVEATAVLVSGGTQLEASRVTLRDNGMRGLMVLGEGTLVVLDGFESTGGTSRDLDTAAGIVVQDEAEVRAVDVLVEQVAGLGLLVQSDGLLSVVGAQIRDTLEFDDPVNAAIGVKGGRFEGQDVSVDRAAGFGVRLEGEGSFADIDGLVVTGVVKRSGDLASAVSVDLGGVLELSGFELRTDSSRGVIVQREGTATLQDGLVVDGRASGHPYSAPCLQVEHPLTLVTVTGVELTGCGSGGVFSRDEALVQLDDVLIHDLATEWPGIGLLTQSGRIEGVNVTVERAMLAGALSIGFEGYIELVDSVVRLSRGGHSPGDGIGFATQQDASARGERLVVQDNVGGGLYSLADADLECIDCEVSGNGFAGALVTSGASLLLEGGTVQANGPSSSQGGGVGIFAWDFEGATALTLDGVQVADHLGPGLYLRGRGDHVISGSTFVDNGTASASPAGSILAMDLVGAAAGDLELHGNLLSAPAGRPPVLLHRSDATLDGNVFEHSGQWDVYRQRCEDTVDLVVIGEAPTVTSCTAPSLEVDPKLDYFVAVIEEGVEQ